MTFYRICKAAYRTAEQAFNGLGSSRINGRWTLARPDMRAVYCSESLALACLETLVHIRPLPRQFTTSVYYQIEIPDDLIERPQTLPRQWRSPIPRRPAQEFGTRFLLEQRAVALLLPTAVLDAGWNAVVNPRHPKFDLRWVEGPHRFSYDQRLA